jgi:tRNA-Thr(GGU) m(6)t(6)A37 methyltransferase TsaA
VTCRFSTRPLTVAVLKHTGLIAGYSGEDMDEVVMRPIGHVRSPYAEAGQVPKGLGTRHTAEGVLEVLPEFESGLQDIEGFSHLIVLWVFHRSEGHELIGVNPADKEPHGVFATHSPRRPNPIAITIVELVRREGSRLHVRGIDMIDGTPVLDIKPYTSGVPAEKLRRGWLAEAEARKEKAGGG